MGKSSGMAQRQRGNGETKIRRLTFVRFFSAAPPSLKGDNNSHSKVTKPNMLNTRNEERILFIVCLFYEYIHLEYVRIHLIYRVNQAEHVIHIRVLAPQEYVNIYSTCRH